MARALTRSTPISSPPLTPACARRLASSANAASGSRLPMLEPG
ncbi:Uncharacterised protein [Bordetella pertussis]|nr:Uncharacterised protein [Bordetella pertussis]